MPPAKRAPESRGPEERPPGERTGRAAGSGRSTPAAAGPEPAAPERDRPERFDLRLPFLTVSVTRPTSAPAAGATGQHPAGSATGGPPGGPGMPRWLFYGGLAALGVAGVVDWPVAAAIAAGTYVASRARSLSAVAPPAGTDAPPGPGTS